jgi:hypothetical protein
MNPAPNFLTFRYFAVVYTRKVTPSLSAAERQIYVLVLTIVFAPSSSEHSPTPRLSDDFRILFPFRFHSETARNSQFFVSKWVNELPVVRYSTWDGGSVKKVGRRQKEK